MAVSVCLDFEGGTDAERRTPRPRTDPLHAIRRGCFGARVPFLPFLPTKRHQHTEQKQQQPLCAVAEPRRAAAAAAAAAAASETASCNYYYRLPRYDEVQIAYRLPVIDYLCSCTALHANGDAISRDNWLCLLPPPFTPAGPPSRRRGGFLVNELEHFRVD